ncbi:DNA topology modulation protein FlaR [Psychrobacillus glaciei]|uniref:DNA topology modulation protein FlaR n=1 Tax=Psychrobacillus glaciei TaxID=2283160 RepID=A0A5J6SIV5_9BACI|nr:DNA topology modulation protein FlaR [Psychrobacillus glaciei]QFF97529.1 DNA topology modulation protein FlaR [Psychrobacillus glaciei]
MKVYIVGSVGSGKTTLARKVARTLQIPHFETDNFVWKRHAPEDIRNEVEVRNQLLLNVVALDNWIIEGVHIDWTDPGLRAADQIIFLDIPVKSRSWRIVARYIRQLIKVEKANYKPTLTIFFRMFKWNRYFEEQMKPSFQMKFNKFNHKVHHFVTDKEVEEWLQRIERG